MFYKSMGIIKIVIKKIINKIIKKIIKFRNNKK